jgi:hypothetical protein
MSHDVSHREATFVARRMLVTWSPQSTRTCTAQLITQKDDLQRFTVSASPAIAHNTERVKAEWALLAPTSVNMGVGTTSTHLQLPIASQ